MIELVWHVTPELRLSTGLRRSPAHQEKDKASPPAGLIMHQCPGKIGGHGSIGSVDRRKEPRALTQVKIQVVIKQFKTEGCP